MLRLMLAAKNLPQIYQSFQNPSIVYINPILIGGYANLHAPSNFMS